MEDLKIIPNSTIEWNDNATNLNFEDREVMETLEKLFMHKKITKRQIITHLENLLNVF